MAKTDLDFKIIYVDSRRDDETTKLLNSLWVKYGHKGSEHNSALNMYTWRIGTDCVATLMPHRQDPEFSYRLILVGDMDSAGRRDVIDGLNAILEQDKSSAKQTPIHPQTAFLS